MRFKAYVQLLISRIINFHRAPKCTHWNEIVHRFKILLYPLELLNIKYLKKIEKANQGHEGQIKGRIGKNYVF